MLQTLCCHIVSRAHAVLQHSTHEREARLFSRRISCARVAHIPTHAHTHWCGRQEAAEERRGNASLAGEDGPQEEEEAT